MVVQGDITGNGNYSNYFGGLIGKQEIAAGKSVRLTNSNYTGNITSTGGHIGGLIGDQAGVSNATTGMLVLSDVFSSGNISGGRSDYYGGNNIGGLIGYQDARESNISIMMQQQAEK